MLIFVACTQANTPEQAIVEDNNVTAQIPETDVPTIVEQEKQPLEIKAEPVPVVEENKVLPKKEPIIKKEATEPELVVTQEEAKEENIKESQEEVSEEKEESEDFGPVAHDQWDALLKKYVSDSGKVNYKGFKADKDKLQAYLDLLAANPINKQWSRNDKMAYWINAYNAFTVKLIVDNYPIASIMKIHNGKAWDKKWIKLGSETYSLNQIENDILRPQYKDARIHFAVNCAAKSCPPLLNRAWTAANLEANFEKQAKAFINNSSFNSISEKKVQVSRIFEWYAGDFGDLIAYLNKYSNVKIKSNARISYREYNWDLNE